MRKPSLIARLGICLCLGIAGCAGNYYLDRRYANKEEATMINLKEEFEEAFKKGLYMLNGPEIEFRKKINKDLEQIRKIEEKLDREEKKSENNPRIDNPTINRNSELELYRAG